MEDLVFPVGFFGVIGSVIVISLLRARRLAKLRGMDFAWYRSKHPELAAGSRVACFSCKSNRIHARGLLQRARLREHFCTQCGTTLYYSREGG
jgi:hypothetical protein